MTYNLLMLAVILVINSKMIDKTVADDIDKKTEKGKAANATVKTTALRQTSYFFQQ
jgi:hypothetical protein